MQAPSLEWTMALLRHHMYHLNRVSLTVMRHLNDAIGRIPFYANDDGSITQLMKKAEALIDQREIEPALERIERFIKQVKVDQAESHIAPHDAESLIEPAMRLIEQLQAQLERQGDGKF